LRLRSRAPAVLALALLLGAALAAGEALVSPLRLALFDAYMHLHPREASESPVVIVAVDDASLRDVGQWPWPRHRQAELVTKILAGRPLALGIDVLWPEPDRSSPRRWLQEEEALPAELAEGLLALPDHDAVLGAALAGGPVVIGVAGVRGGGADRPGPLAPVRVIGGEPEADLSRALPRFDAALRSLPDLDRAAPGHGLLTVDRDADGVIRRMPLFGSVAGRLAPSFGLEVLRLATGAGWIELHLRERRVEGVAVGPLAIPTQSDGTLWVHFAPHAPERYVSAADVLADRTAAGVFEQRLVLLGVTGLGLVDLPITPLGPIPGSEIHAQLLENVLSGSLLERPDWAARAEAALLAAVGALGILALPRLRLRWWLPLALGLLAALAALGLLAFVRERWLLDVASPAAGNALVFVALLGGTLAEADAQRRRLRHELAAQRLAAARIEGELAAAARIQLGMLPRPESLAPDPRYDLDAAIVPARHVGGDLYDFFEVDGDRLFLAIGDVSGKGLPASLFMALAKTLCQSCALRGQAEIGDIVRSVESELSRENPEQLFVTLFAGILDRATGELRFCNAGHEPPFLVRPGAAPRQLEAKGGPPLCSLDRFPYATESHALAPGEILCLFTDGVSESTSPGGELLGRPRIAAALHGLAPGGSARDAVARVRETVVEFAAGAPLPDDVALLAVRWSGPAG
jgi:serine phosphatase RsbU (regulator of sigma subunit)